MSKFTCPYCYGEHSLNDCKVKCTYNIAGSAAACKKGVVKDADGWIPNARKGSCLNCKDASKLIFCPDVNKEIPRDFLEGPSLPIALIGAKASGKSNYIGVLINEIRKNMAKRFNTMLSMTTSEESKRFYDQYYYDPLFNQNVVVNTTDGGEIPPMIFPLRFLDNKNRIAKTATLTFYDTAGENLDSQDDMVVFNRYIPNSKGIILLLDPLQIPTIRDQLQGKMTLPNKNTDVNTVLSRVVDNIRRVKNIKGLINIPLALVFTKIDALEKFDILPQGSCLRHESEHMSRGVFVQSDLESCDLEMRALVENWIDGELEQLIKSFSMCKFFGLTALGDVPKNSGTQLSAKIQPRRVLDPLLWLLAENKYIKKVK